MQHWRTVACDWHAPWWVHLRPWPQLTWEGGARHRRGWFELEWCDVTVLVGGVACGGRWWRWRRWWRSVHERTTWNLTNRSVRWVYYFILSLISKHPLLSLTVRCIKSIIFWFCFQTKKKFDAFTAKVWLDLIWVKTMTSQATTTCTAQKRKFAILNNFNGLAKFLHRFCP